jgi:hypothetical protein
MSRWNLLHTELVAYVACPIESELFSELKAKRPALIPFSDPNAVVREISAKEAPERNALLVELIAIWRQEPRARRLAAAMLLLGLWRDLDLVYQYQTQFSESNQDELEALLMLHFLRALASTGVERAPDVGQSLVRAARRDAKRALIRAQVLQARDLMIGNILVNTTSGSLMPLDEISERELRNTLNRLMRAEDIDLLVEVFLNERPRHWLIERFHKSAAEINARVYRILNRLRRLA